jgi:hypothetical protein
MLDLRSGRLFWGFVPPVAAGAQRTQSTPYESLEALFAAVEIGPDDVLVDVGCGKGRVIHWWLMRGLRNRIIGLELNAKVAARAARTFRRHANVEVRPGDALAALPPEGTIWYLFNPFDRAQLARFRDALTAARGDRGATILYCNMYHEDLFPAPRWDVEIIPSPPHIYGRLAVIRLR